jgi:hypothetical protein
MGLHLKFRSATKKHNIFGEEEDGLVFNYNKLNVISYDNIGMQRINKHQYKKSKAKEIESLVIIQMLFSGDKYKILLAINMINIINNSKNVKS